MATLLILDDHPLNREFLMTLLGASGYLPLEATNGTAALSLARAEQPDLIISDIVMPAMDGFEFVRQLRTDPATAQIPVIFYTAAYRQEEAQVLARECGVSHILIKPAKPQVILAMVNTVLGLTPLPAPPPPPESFDREHLSLLTDKLSQKVTELEEINLRQAALLDLSQELARDRDPVKLLDKVCQVARELTEAKYTAIGVLDDSGIAMRHFVGSGLETEIAALPGLPAVGPGLLSQLLQQSYMRSRDHLSPCSETAALPSSALPARSFLSIPLGSPTRQYGWLYLTEKVGADEFSQEDELLAATLAAQATLAYENAMHYAEIQRHTAELEQRVQERTAELQRSNADLERFAYVASHDLQEPLRMVSNYCQLLERRYQGQLDENANTYIAYAVDGARRMQELIKGLLEYSRLRQPLQVFKPVDCQQIVAQAYANLREAIQESGAQVTWTTLPVVQADPALFLSLFQNLIGNALKFRDHLPPQVHVSAEQTDQAWRFAVRDNGIGIEPAHFERIFEVFQRLHGRSEYPGTGIGLATCHRIVQHHGGRIWVDSRPGQGSTFYFTIPEQGLPVAQEGERG